MRHTRWLGTALLLAIASLSSAASPRSDLVKAELLADTASIKPGAPFTLGVLLHIEPGWHIYWTNPGDSGLATSVKFKLPPGLKAGPVQYPVPMRIELPGNVVNYGYERQVMLIATVTPAKSLTIGSQVTITAEVQWLCCKDVCLPGSAKSQFTVSIADEATPATQDLFRQWSAQVPAEGIGPDISQVKGGLEHGRDGSISILWAHMPRDVSLFPAASDALAVSAASVNNGDGRTDITFKLERLPGQEPNAKAYRIVIGYTTTDGQRRGFYRDFPIRSVATSLK